MIRGPDGRMTPIRFPKPVASSIGYDLDVVLPGFFARLEEILMPEAGHPLLRLARYQPERYPAGGGDAGEDTALIGLLRSALLKRFESSAEAFRRTVGRMIRQHETFLDALARGYVVRKEFFRDLSAAEDEGDIEEILEASEHADDASAFDVVQLEADVQADLSLLRELATVTERVHPEGDPKLAALVEELAAIAKQAAGEAVDDEDARQKRKVLVFSHYEDTIDWVEEDLRQRIEADPRLAVYRGRVASVSGAEVRGGVRREQALRGFAPVSTGALPPDSEDRFDLLLCTDVLAEGMNLQQCRNVVNYDLPWNPMRLVQRHGRVDRIASPHPKVFLRTFFPDAQLDALLNLERRVRRKLAQAAASVGVEETPIEQERLHRCLDAIESPWPRRDENLLRLAGERSFPTAAEKARHLIEEVERIGAEPFRSPAPLPPIDEEEIHVIAWMAIERKNAEGADYADEADGRLRRPQLIGKPFGGSAARFSRLPPYRHG